MTITIQRGRQFAAGDAQVQLFDEDGDAGTYLTKASEKLAAQNVAITVGEGPRQVTLSTVADWRAFLDAHCSTQTQTERFAAKFGITFSDFANVVDDVAASADIGLTIDLGPGSDVAKALSLDRIDGDYAAKLAKGEQVNLTGGSTTPATAVAAGVPTIGPEILANTLGSNWSWERDRTEQESWADFRNTGSSTEKFKELTGPAPYAKLYKPKWDDAEAMAMVNEFALPLHLEVKGTNPDGTVKFQDGYEMFRDAYFEDRNGALGKAGASVRARVRFDNTAPFAVNRVLVQAKEGRELNGAASAVHKFEKRSWSGGNPSEDDLKTMLITGQDQSVNGQPARPLEVAQKLYKLTKDRGTLGPDGLLQLEEKYVVLQKRRRTHLQLDSVSEVEGRRTDLKQQIDVLTTAGSPVPDAMTKYLAKLDAQIVFMNTAATTLRKYGQWSGSGECFIISADRYNVYDPTARKGSAPTDISDDVGRIGKGPLHVEAEWDSASSDSFEKAIAEIDKRLAATTPAPDPATVTTLKADRASIESMREVFRGDVAKTVEVLRAKLSAAGLREDTEKKPKDQRAADLANAPNRPQFWF